MRCEIWRGQILLAAVTWVLIVFATSPAWALSCADIPGARIDPDLNTLFPGQGFGRLIPEFKTEERTAQETKNIVAQRDIAQVYVLEGDARVIVSRLADDRVGAVMTRGGNTTRSEPVDAFPGLQSVKIDALADQFPKGWNVSMASTAVPPPRDIAASFPTLAGNARVEVAKTVQSLPAQPGQQETETIKFFCSSDARYAGDPGRLSKFVVLSGTVKAVSTIIRTTQQRTIELTVIDYAVVQEASAQDLASQLTMFPEIVSELLVIPDAGSSAAPELHGALAGTRASARHVDVAVPQTAPAPTIEPVAGLANQSEKDGSYGLRTGGWPQLLSAMAGLTAVLLVLLFVPQVRFSRKETIPASRSNKADETDTGKAAVTAKIANDNANADASADSNAGGTKVASNRQGDAEAADEVIEQASNLQRRLELLERLSQDAGGLHRQVSKALDTVVRDADKERITSAQTKALDQKLQATSVENRKLADRLAASARELDASRAQTMNLKLEIADLKVRLAKSEALSQSARSIIDELHSASDSAVSLTSEYKDEIAKLETEVSELRSTVAAHDDVSQGREQLLESTLATNEELERALVQEREKRRLLSQRLLKLESDRHSSERANGQGMSELETALRAASQDLKASQESKANIQRQLHVAVEDRRKADEAARTARRDIMQQRVDFSVKAKLLEDNIQALTVYVSEIEELLARHDIAIPDYLSLAPRQKPTGVRLDEQGDPVNIVSFQSLDREAG